jgi:hypothetical protein
MRKRCAYHRASVSDGGRAKPVTGAHSRAPVAFHPAHRYPAMSHSLVPQYRSTIRSSFLLSNQDRPRNPTNITMPRPEEALFMDASEN